MDGDLAIHGGAPFGWRVLYGAYGPLGVDAHLTAQLVLLVLAFLVPAMVFWIEGQRRSFPYVTTILSVGTGSIVARLLVSDLRHVTMWKEPLVFAWVLTIVATLLGCLAVAMAFRCRANSTGP